MNTVFGVGFDELCADVYFREDFVALHNRPHGVDGLADDGFLHRTGVRPIPESGREDLSTPHGYGGPLARGDGALRAGLAAWRSRQQKAGRVAEFIRFHPCIDPTSAADAFDTVSFNRTTVMVDLGPPADRRQADYSQSTRRFLRKAQQALAVRRLTADDAPLFHRMYDAMLDRHGADARYRLDLDYFTALLTMPWCVAWATEVAGRAVAASCFLITACPIAHYHLGGAEQAGLDLAAQFLLFETAFDHAAGAGCRWLHLGGGRTPDAGDSLLAFKQRFSRVTARFHVGGLIFDRETYASLGGAKGGMFLGYRGAAG